MKLKNKIQDSGIGIIGIPFDENSSFRKGPALAPARIREAYFSKSSNLWAETGINLEELDNLHDFGDIDFKKDENSFQSITETVRNRLDENFHLICLGGDHSITFPVMKAHAVQYSPINILHLDAHPDLYDCLEGNRLSHACPFARIMEQKWNIRLVQAGIRTMTGHQRNQAAKFGVETMEMKDMDSWPDRFEFTGPVYLSLDLDCLDPGSAPGVSHHEPGGMTTRHVINIIHKFKGRLIGADIVEYNPEKDIFSMTAMVAAKLLKEIIARIHHDNFCFQ